MRQVLSAIAVLIAAAALSACALLPGDSEPAAGAADLGPFPASFEGELPCADCPGIHYQLNLYDNHTYFLRMTYEGEDARFDEAGRWAVSDDGRTLILRGGGEGPMRFGIQEGGDSLQMLNRDGNPIDSPLNYELQRQARYTAFDAER